MLLEVEGISKRFGGMLAVDSVSLSVESREIVGLIGPNGAGKTTTFNLIAGSLGTPDAGRVMFDGRDVTRVPVHRRCALGIARTWQVIKPFPQMSVLDNVLVGALLHGSDIPAAQRRSAEWVERTGLAHKMHWLASALTNADRKMLELARALATGPKLLLLDEPMAGLTETEVDRFVQLVRALRRDGISFLLIEHVLRGLMPLVDRIVVLAEGRRIANGTPVQIARDPAVIAAYLGTDYLLDNTIPH